MNVRFYLSCDIEITLMSLISKNVIILSLHVMYATLLWMYKHFPKIYKPPVVY